MALLTLALHLPVGEHMHVACMYSHCCWHAWTAAGRPGEHSTSMQQLQRLLLAVTPQNIHLLLPSNWARTTSLEHLKQESPAYGSITAPFGNNRLSTVLRADTLVQKIPATATHKSAWQPATCDKHIAMRGPHTGRYETR